MTERQKTVLEAVIEEYIADAQPVGSKILGEKYDFGIGSAMIRQEMAVLEKEGYLDQPHTSAGRVPTDEAYRFYIGSELNKEKGSLPTRDQGRVQRAVNKSENPDELNRELARVISEISRELSIVGIVGGTHFIHGYSYLTHEPEFEDLDLLSEFMQFMDGLDRSFGQLFDLLASGPTRVFIGKENPVPNIQNFAVVTGRYRLPRGERGFISVIGPKRMDYKKNMAIVEYVSSVISKS